MSATRKLGRRVDGVGGGGINADVTMPPPSVIDRVARWRRHAHRQGRRYFGRHAPPSLTPSTSLPLRAGGSGGRRGLSDGRTFLLHVASVSLLSASPAFAYGSVFSVYSASPARWLVYRYFASFARCSDRSWRGEVDATSWLSPRLLPVRRFCPCRCLRLFLLAITTNLLWLSSRSFFFSSCGK